MVCYSDSFLRFLKKAEPKTFGFSVVYCMAERLQYPQILHSGSKVIFVSFGRTTVFYFEIFFSAF